MNTILEMQKELQSKLHVKNQTIKSIDNIPTLGEKCDALMYNKNALDYEFKEVLEALSASDDPSSLWEFKEVLEALSASDDPSSLWKNWKLKYNETRSKLYADLTPIQKRELQMEFVDMFCFFLNMMLVLEIDSETLFSLYKEKYKINLNRIKDY